MYVHVQTDTRDKHIYTALHIFTPTCIHLSIEAYIFALGFSDTFHNSTMKNIIL